MTPNPNKKQAVYSMAITREQFLYKECKIVAEWVLKGLSFEEIVKKCLEENLFQLPTLKSVREIARVCYNRLMFNGDMDLIGLVANGVPSEAKLTVLYAFMCQNLIIRDFMVEVIGEKYKTGVYYYDRSEAARFLFNLGNRVESVSKVTDETTKKVRAVLTKCLAEAGYLTTVFSNDLLQVDPGFELGQIIRNDGNEYMLPAFNVLQ